MNKGKLLRDLAKQDIDIDCLCKVSAIAWEFGCSTGDLSYFIEIGEKIKLLELQKKLFIKEFEL